MRILWGDHLGSPLHGLWAGHWDVGGSQLAVDAGDELGAQWGSWVGTSVLPRVGLSTELLGLPHSMATGVSKGVGRACDGRGGTRVKL